MQSDRRMNLKLYFRILFLGLKCDKTIFISCDLCKKIHSLLGKAVELWGEL